MKISPLTQFKPLLPAAEKTETPEQLKKAVDGFETLFAHQMLESMQSDLEGGSIFGGGVEGNTLGAMAQWELAGKLADKLDLGIEKDLLAQLAARKGEK
ncbi:MAG: hypothetical protein H6506_04410 [Calditrichaeota bacterium]|nr:hypothetical protein [Calditrichota bacterium]MCB9391876.1 hypothetical protein [Calditrichota bacterium]